MRALILATALAVAQTSTVGAAPVPASQPATSQCVSCRYTGAQLIQDYFPNKGVSYARHVEAWAYIDGVYDATEGRDWCYPKAVRINPDELAGGVAWALRELPATALKGNAAPLIVAYLRKKFPCL